MEPDQDQPARLQGVVTQLSPIEARIEVWGELPAGWTADHLTGKLIGPYQEWGRTLKSHLPLIRVPARSPAGPWFAVTVPEPTTWTQLAPACYEIQLGVQPAAEPILGPWSMVLRIGLKLLAARRTSLHWEGARWVLRGLSVAAGAELPADPQAWRDAYFTLVTDATDTALLSVASRWGIPALVNLTHLAPGAALSAAARAAAWPAVIGTIVDVDVDPHQVRAAAPNLLILGYRSGAEVGQTASTPSAGSTNSVDAWVCSEELLRASTPDQLPQPLVAVRTVADDTPWSVARHEIDRLQAALSPTWNLAGYLALPRHKLVLPRHKLAEK